MFEGIRNPVRVQVKWSPTSLPAISCLPTHHSMLGLLAFCLWYAQPRGPHHWMASTGQLPPTNLAISMFSYSFARTCATQSSQACIVVSWEFKALVLLAVRTAFILFLHLVAMAQLVCMVHCVLA